MTSRRVKSTDAMPKPTSTAKKRSNDTHVSTTDPEPRLYRKGMGKEINLCLVVNRRAKLTPIGVRP